jgi:hypothetical protein
VLVAMCKRCLRKRVDSESVSYRNVSAEATSMLIAQIDPAFTPNPVGTTQLSVTVWDHA